MNDRLKFYRTPEHLTAEKSNQHMFPGLFNTTTIIYHYFYLCLSLIIKMRLKERENEVMERHKSKYDTANDTIND